jgi:purine-nucleoside phosphorylase
MPETDEFERVQTTVEWLDERIDETPDIAMVLGSGLGALADELTDATAFSYGDIPNYPVSAVEGHAGELVFGQLEGRPVVVMSGRVHYYEGWSAKEVTLPMRSFGQLGIEKTVITNSAGGVNPDFSPGDLMVISDHLNLTGTNPLRGLNDERFGPRFPDMTDTYDDALRSTVRAAAARLGIDLKQGVYAGMAGPSYETPAEIQMLQTLGADAVGMSTVPEAIVANHMGMQVVGISCITNLAAGLGDEKLDHDDVKRVAADIRETFATLVKAITTDI